MTNPKEVKTLNKAALLSKGKFFDGGLLPRRNDAVVCDRGREFFVNSDLARAIKSEIALVQINEQEKKTKE